MLAVACATIGVMLVGSAPAVALPSWLQTGPGFAVACISEGRCESVGNSFAGKGTLRAWGWNGGSWRAQALAEPSDYEPVLRSVACQTASFCMAVGGSATLSGTPIAERWDGQRWTQLPVPVPPGDVGPRQTVVLNGVACLSSEWCMAVGSVDNDNVYRLLAERWDGARWSRLAAPGVGRRCYGYGCGGLPTLNGISCLSHTDCFAVGSGGGPLIARWNGTRWKRVDAPYPTGAHQGYEFDAIDCASSRRCEAVGAQYVQSRLLGGHLWLEGDLAEGWDGHRWKLQDAHGPIDHEGELLGVACASAVECRAVGFHGRTRARTRLAGVLLGFDGARWRRVPLHRGVVGWSGIACPSTRSCTAVLNR
jgi:hypothetical protein